MRKQEESHAPSAPRGPVLRFMRPLAFRLFSVCTLTACAWFPAHANSLRQTIFPLSVPVAQRELSFRKEAGVLLSSPALYGADPRPQEIESCIVSVCGPASKNWTSVDSLEVRLEESDRFDQVWTYLVRSTMRKTLSLEREKNLLQLQRLQSLLKNEAPIPQNHPMQALLAYSFLLKKYVMGNLDQLVYPDYGENAMKVDDLGVASIVEQISSPLESAAVKLIAEKVLQPLQSAKRPLSSGNLLQDRLANLYPDLPAGQGLKIDAQRVLIKANRFKALVGTIMGNELVDEVEMTAFRKAASGYDLNKLESAIYAKGASSLDSLLPAIDGELHDALMKIPFDLGASLKTIKKHNLLNAALQRTETFTLESRLEKAEAACRPRIAVALSSTASPVAYSHLQALSKEAKASAKTVVAAFVDNSTRPYMERMIDEIEFVYPGDAREPMADLLADLHLEAAKSHATLDALKKGGKQVDDMLLVMAPLLVAKDNDGDFEATLDQCQKIPLASISDYSLTATGKISLSWFSAAYLDVGMGILAHEMGHVVSSHLRGLKDASKQAPGFMKTLNCVANRNPFITSATSLQPHDNTFWSEEDWADFFSSRVLNELEKKKSLWMKYSKNVGCALINDSGFSENANYGGNSLRPDLYDFHSSGFLRLLMVATDRRRMTPQCQPLLRYASTHQRTLQCQ